MSYLNPDFKSLLSALILLLITNRIYVFIRKLKEVDYITGPRVAFNPFALPGAFFPTTKFTVSTQFQWELRHSLYAKYGTDTVSVVPFLSGYPIIWTNSLEFTKRATTGGSQSTWVKPYWISQALMIWGMNLVSATGGEEWRRHRRILGPAYNNALYELVWEESIRVYRDMVSSEGWLKKDTFDATPIQDISSKFALMIIIACGFGSPITWFNLGEKKNNKMSLHQAIRLLSDNIFLRTGFPSWIRNLPIKAFRDVETSYETLDKFFREQIVQRKGEIKEEIKSGRDSFIKRRDVFSRLVYANEDPEEKYPLNDEELIGNVYGLLLAGHETTGHTLAVALGFLALYQEEQKLVYEHIIDVIGKDREPTYSDYHALNKVLAVFYEATRLFPGGTALVRVANEDTTISVNRIDGKVENHFIRKGTAVFFDILGMQYNARYFEDPEAFKPSRWYGQKNSEQPDALTAFSLGPRACIGRRFATTEAVAFLALFLRDWHVDIILKEGQSREKWDTVLRMVMKITFMAEPICLKITRRK